MKTIGAIQECNGSVKYPTIVLYMLWFSLKPCDIPISYGLKKHVLSNPFYSAGLKLHSIQDCLVPHSSSFVFYLQHFSTFSFSYVSIGPQICLCFLKKIKIITIWIPNYVCFVVVSLLAHGLSKMKDKSVKTDGQFIL